MDCSYKDIAFETGHASYALILDLVDGAPAETSHVSYQSLGSWSLSKTLLWELAMPATVYIFLASSTGALVEAGHSR